ncbi:MAG: PIN domain-containing protein [Chitinophagales bacterium]|nr:PIN domain-containing protein [Chitinophagales bacterium]
MDILLDTNLILLYSRESEISKRIENEYDLFSKSNQLSISIVTLGELDALTKKLGLGPKRKERIKNTVANIAKVRLNIKEIIDRYGDIDAFSQGKLKEKRGIFSSRNMGKNDLWIAATASVFNLKLFTTDKDFDHLKGEYLDLEYIDINKFKN